MNSETYGLVATTILSLVLSDPRSTMDEKGPENPAESEQNRLRREGLAPGKVADFPGSLVANQLKTTPKASFYPQDKRNLANWVAYLREGWDDPAIWKSAVRI